VTDLRVFCILVSSWILQIKELLCYVNLECYNEHLRVGRMRIAKRFEQSQYKVTFDNFAVNGFRTEHVLNQVLFDETIKAKIVQAEFVTIDIGGNDVLPAVRLGGDVPGAISKAATNIHIILHTIDQLNPNFKINFNNKKK
jgi:hypothetical protein